MCNGTHIVTYIIWMIRRMSYLKWERPKHTKNVFTHGRLRRSVFVVTISSTGQQRAKIKLTFHTLETVSTSPTSAWLGLEIMIFYYSKLLLAYILLTGCAYCIHIYFLLCSCVTISINSIYSEVLKTQISFLKAEPTLEFNRSMLTLITPLPVSFNSLHFTQIPKWRARIIPSKVITLQGQVYRCEHSTDVNTTQSLWPSPFIHIID